MTYVDRKVWASIQLRRGPNVVGPFGLLQPMADGLKLLLKETIVPSSANGVLFIIAPDDRLHDGTGRLGGRAVRRWLGDRRHQCRHPLPVRHLFARRLRHHHRGLGIELEVRLPGGAALGGADGVLRGLDRLRADHCPALRRVRSTSPRSCSPSQAGSSTGSGCRCCRCSSSSSSRRWPRPTARRSTCRCRKPSWWQASTPNIRP